MVERIALIRLAIGHIGLVEPQRIESRLVVEQPVELIGLVGPVDEPPISRLGNTQLFLDICPQERILCISPGTLGARIQFNIQLRSSL